MNRLISRHKDALACLIIVSLTVIFFWQNIFQGLVFISGDNLSINLPSKILLVKMIQNRQSPLWNPYIFSGSSFLADINLGLLAPINVIYFLLSPLYALTTTIIVDLLLAGIFMYWYCRTILINRYGSLIASIIFMFSGTMMQHTHNTAVLNVIIWLPLILLLLEKYFQTKNIKFLLLGAIAGTIQLFSGHIQYFYYSLLFIIPYCLWRDNRQFKEKILSMFIFILIIFGLGAIQLLPFIELVKISTRPIFDIAYASSASPVVSLIHLILPNFFGVMKDGTSWGATADINGYVGIVPLLAVTFLIAKQSSRLILFNLTVVLVSFFIALGKYSPVYYIFLYLVPFFSRFRSPPGILYLYTFSLAILTGLAIDYFFKKYDFKINRKVYFFLLTGIIIGLICKIINYSVLIQLFKQLNQIFHVNFITKFLNYPQIKIETIYSLWINNFLFILFIITSTTVLFDLTRINSKFNYYYKIIFLFIIASDLFFFGKNIYICDRPSLLDFPNRAIKILKTSTYDRILTLTDEGSKPPFGDANYFKNEAEKMTTFFQVNMNIVAGLYSIDGYASVVNKTYAQYLSSYASSNPTGLTLPQPTNPRLNQLGVSYVLTGGRYKNILDNNPQFKMIYQYKNTNLNKNFYIYQNKLALPRAYLIDIKGQKIGQTRIIHYSENSVIINSQSRYPGKVILTDVYAPGWQVFVNGKRSKIVKFQNVLRSVDVTQGKNNIRFVYQPITFITGANISLIAWLVALIAIFFLPLKNHEYISHKLHIGKTKIKRKTK